MELEEEGKALEERKAGLDQRRADLEEEEKKLQQAEKQLAKRKQTLAKAEKAVKDGSASAEEIAEYKKQKSALRKRDLRIRTDRELYETHKLELADDERVYRSEKEAFDEKNTLFHKGLEENRTASLKKFKADWQAATTALTTDYAEHLAEAKALCDHPVTISSSETSPTANMRSDAAQIKTSEDLREILEKVRLATENGPYWKISGGDPKLLELGNLIRETEQGLEREKAISISDGNGHVRFGHKADPDLVKRVQEFINQFCDSVDAAPTPDKAKLNGCQTFGSYYRTLDVNAGKQPQAIQMQENLAEIQKIYAKMTSEGRLHINSSSYKRMRDSVKAVCEMGFNPYSEASVKEMQKRLKEMHEATAAYAEKRVDGKTKKTDLGVTRGNEALLLMRLSGETASVDKIKITDKRMEKGKKATTLSELMAQEKPAAKEQAPKHSSRQHQKSVSKTAEQSKLS